MLLDSYRSRASPGAKSSDYDGEPLIAKCGPIKIWHWARKSKDPDHFAEPESEWHLNWKNLVPDQNIERFISKNGVNHRADIVTNSGRVVEIQHSAISPDQIIEREQFYGNMIWVFDASSMHFDTRFRGQYHSFRWKWPRQSIFFCNKPLYFDLGEYVFRVKKIHHHCPVGGWGHLRWKFTFQQWLKKACQA